MNSPEHEFQSSFPLKRTVAALAVGAATVAGIKTGMFSDHRPPRYVAVPDQGEDHDSPTDDMANKIAATNYVSDRLENGKTALPKGLTAARVIDFAGIERARSAERA